MKFVRLLEEKKRLNFSILLAISSVFSFLLFSVHSYVSKSTFYSFMNWNLFLAFIPWIITSILILFPAFRNKVLAIIAVGSWVLFFPNSPYILTDLFHLNIEKASPLWLDLILTLSYAWTALLFGFLSLLDLKELYLTSFNTKVQFLVINLFFFLTAFGVYLGRFLRWNSWDIINDPITLFYDIAHRFVYPFQHPRTWGVTLLMGVMLAIFFWSFYLFSSNKSQTIQKEGGV